jgi:hypothetical protein
MIFLSKKGEDTYINDFAKGCGAEPTSTDDFSYDDGDDSIILRGILKHDIMNQCRKDKRDFYYMDTGYFGNGRYKTWHRIVKNDLQHDKIVQRPDDRFRQFAKPINQWKKDGTKILIAAPDEKPCKHYGIDRDDWIDATVKKIEKATDRPIEIRNRVSSRLGRLADPLEAALADDVFALVTFNSVAATEALFYGIPVFISAHGTKVTNAAAPLAYKDLRRIEKPKYADMDERYAWACHLAYGQFHVSEMKDGSALDKLKDWF